MAYVDGFVLPLPRTKLESYRDIAAKCGAIWREHGALEFRECIAEDVKPGKLTSFPKASIWKPMKRLCSHGSSIHRASIATKSTTR